LIIFSSPVGNRVHTIFSVWCIVYMYTYIIILTIITSLVIQ